MWCKCMWRFMWLVDRVHTSSLTGRSGHCQGVMWLVGRGMQWHRTRQSNQWDSDMWACFTCTHKTWKWECSKEKQKKQRFYFLREQSDSGLDLKCLSELTNQSVLTLQKNDSIFVIIAIVFVTRMSFTLNQVLFFWVIMVRVPYFLQGKLSVVLYFSYFQQIPMCRPKPTIVGYILQKNSFASNS